MKNKDIIVNKLLFYRIILYVTLLPVLYFFINFDLSKNLDYVNYKNNYDNFWNQFEIGYTALESISRALEFNFEKFWFFLICIELILIALLYTNPYVFILAFPNLLFLSQGLLGTQIRFGIAILLCLVIFKYAFTKKRFYIYSIGATLFHNGTIIFIFLSVFLKRMFNFNESILNKTNVINVLLFIMILLAVSLVVENILLSMGYHYYVGSDSKHMVERSLVSLIYTSCFLIFIFALLQSQYKPVKYAHIVYLGGMMLILSLVFYQNSIISGRYTLVFMLIEPFILYSYYKTIGNKSDFGFFSFIILFSITSSKLLTINLIF